MVKLIKKKGMGASCHAYGTQTHIPHLIQANPETNQAKPLATNPSSGL
jgi:hypothetical protein